MAVVKILSQFGEIAPVFLYCAFSFKVVHKLPEFLLNIFRAFGNLFFDFVFPNDLVFVLLFIGLVLFHILDIIKNDNICQENFEVKAA